MNLYLNEYSSFIAEWRERNNFVTNWDNMLEKLMLVVSEVSEAAEAYRNDDKENFEEEIADTFIRLMDIVGTLHIDIEAAIKSKMNTNLKRPSQHGKKRGDVRKKG